MDPRRLGHAQRRRVGAPSNVYGDTLLPPAHGVGDTVKAQGRYRTQTITGVVPNVVRPDGVNDGHGYVVTGGKTGRETLHLSGEIEPFELGTEEAT
jgi:hypothetical protein